MGHPRLNQCRDFLSNSAWPLVRILYKLPGSTLDALIDTPLQRGVTCRQDLWNRFNGFSRAVETVEIQTVSDALRTRNTPLKQGVNEKQWLRSFSWKYPG